MPPDPPPEGAPVGRRVFLGVLGLGVLGIAVGDRLSAGLSSALGAIETHDPTGLVASLPLGNGFRYYSVTGGVPHRDGTDYELRVGGLVQQPGRHSLADLRAMPQTTLTRDFQCVTGWRVPQVRWSGVRLSHLLDLAAPVTGATAVRLTSFDGSYSESLTLEQARRDDVLVALRMLDGPVSHDHGGPVRLYVAPMYGYKSLKWLSGIELTADVRPGYWETRGYDVDGGVGRSNGRDDDPTG